MLQAGSQAPNFTLKNQDDNDVSLADYSGGWLLLWWFPAANAAGDALQGSGLQAALGEFEKKGCAVAGISFDSVAESAAYRERAGFSFPLLSDPEQLVSGLYQTIRNPSEEHYQFPLRISYLIDPQGRILRAYEVHDPGGHAATVLADLEAAHR